MRPSPVVAAQMVPRGGGTAWHVDLRRRLVTSGFIAPGHGPWLGGLLVPLALLLLTLGLWLLPRSVATLRTHAARAAGLACGGGCWRIAGAFS